MRPMSAPPFTPTSVSGWTKVVPAASHRAFLVRHTSAGDVFVPELPALARDARGRPRVALTLVLARMPEPADVSIAPLVTSGHFSLLATLEAADADRRALTSTSRSGLSPLFIRDVTASLADANTEYAVTEPLGSQPQFWLGCALPPEAALDVLHALDGARSKLSIRLVSRGSAPIPFAPVALDHLLTGALDGFERDEFVSLIVVHADGTSQQAPTLQRSLAQRAAPAPSVDTFASVATPPVVVAIDKALVGLQYALAPDATLKPSAAALIASNATGERIQLSPNSQYYVGGDAIIADDEPDALPIGPTEHLPMVDTSPGAAFWPDALDAKSAWYAPVIELVAPAPDEAPAQAAFAFEYQTNGTTLGPRGSQLGLSANVRLTLRAVMSAQTKDALAAAGNPPAQPVPLNNLVCSLEVPYRQSGSTTPTVQRFPGSATQLGDSIVVTVALLDDWVRLTYSALAYPPALGIDPPRIVVDYAFSAYAWIIIRVGTKLQAISGGKIAGVPQMLASELPPKLERPVLLQDKLTFVAPRSYLQYRLEAPRPADGARAAPVALPFSSQHAISTQLSLSEARPLDKPELVARRRAVKRSIVREETALVSLPCASLGAFYRQIAADGTATSIGCQDALRLGETATKAFQEMVALRSAEYRVHRSLQQPGRFLVVPSAYRVGRYAASAPAGRAFRPIIVLYGVIDPDPAKNVYAITTTLIPDVSGYALTLLGKALRAYVPANAPLDIVYPTDPFVAAQLGFNWAVPQGVNQPQAFSVLDAINVTLTVGLADAALLMAMIDRSGVQGAVTFTLPDATAYTCALSIDGAAIGPPGGSPAPASIATGTATLTNRTQQALNVLDAAVVDDAGNVTSLPVNVTLAPGAATTLSVAANATDCIANARLAAQLGIEELDVFVEDVTLTVTFINQVSFSNHSLLSLQLRAKLKDSEHIETVELPEGTTASVSFTLPITGYVKTHELQYTLNEIRATGVTTTRWIDWDLNTGSVIGITADIIE